MMDDQLCSLCGGQLEQRLIRYISGDNPPVFVDHVPAQVCDRCGTEMMAWEVGKVLSRVVRERPQPTRWIQVPVYEFADLPKDVTAAPTTA